MDDLKTRLTKALPDNANNGYWRDRIKEELENAVDHLSLMDIVWGLAQIAEYKHETTEETAWLEDQIFLQEMASCLNH